MDQPIPEFQFEERTPVKMPLRWFITIVGIVASGIAAWLSTRADVVANVRRIDSHDLRFEKVEDKLDAQRAILFEIRADVKQLDKRRAEREP